MTDLSIRAAVLLVFFVLLLLAPEVGFRIGLRRRDRSDEAARSQIGTIQGAALALLGLLLGFTFSMSVSRYDARKQLVIEEANAIGTAELRGRLLPSPQRERVAPLFRRYLDTRIAVYEALDDSVRTAALAEETAQLSENLWSEARDLASADPRSAIAALFVQALNEMYDIREKRDRGLDNHLPPTVMWLVAGVAVFGQILVGYGCGLNGRRLPIATSLLSVLIALVVVLIIDLDRPRGGLVLVGQESMKALRDGLPPQAKGR